jgi:hypothetical protein
MEKGLIKINIEDGRAPSVEAHLVNNTVWMASWDIARFFNCFVQKIDANIRSIFKNHLLWENDCTYCNRYIDKGIEKQFFYYNLEVLIFLSYRIGTMESRIFRSFVNNSLREHFNRQDNPENCTIVWMSPPCYN